MTAEEEIQKLAQIEQRLGRFRADTKMASYKSDELREIIVTLKTVRESLCDKTVVVPG